MKSKWFALGVDPVDCTIVVVGVSEQRHEAEAEFQAVGDQVVYRRAFDLSTGTFSHDIAAWLAGCGVQNARGVTLQCLRQMIDLAMGDAERKPRP